MVKKLFAILLLTGFCFAVFSQNVEGINARIDGMGGSGMTADLGWSVGHPCQIGKFPNQFQGTIYTTPIPDIGETFGAIIAVLAFGDIVRLGFTFNERIHMPYGFYKDGGFYLEAKHINGDNAADKFAMVPSLSLCFQFNSDFSLGIGGYFEGQGYDVTEDNVFRYAPASGGDSITVNWAHNEIKKKIRVYGVVIDGWFAIGGLHVRPEFTYGFPAIQGQETGNYITKLERSLQANPAAAGATFDGIEEDITWSSPNTRLIKTGILMWAANDNFEVDWGVWYQQKSYQFTKDVINDTVTLDATGNRTYNGPARGVEAESHRNSTSIDYFIGLAPAFADNFTFAPEYDGGFGWGKFKDPDIAADSSFFHMYHNFRLGIEKHIADFWFFDRLTFRSGVVAYWTKEWRYIENGGFDGTTTSDENMPWGSFFWGSEFGKKQAKVAGGIGLKKGRGQFDVSVDFLKWKQGVVSGPPSAMATINIDFGRNK